MNVFKIAFSKGEYSVSIPNYTGGDVVPYETAKALADELAKERAKVAKLQAVIDYMLSSLDTFQTVAADALNETKPKEPKRIS